MKALASELNMYQAQVGGGWRVLGAWCCTRGLLAPASTMHPTAHPPQPSTHAPTQPCQVAEYKHEIERLQREMNEVKKAYFEQRREARGAAAAAAGAKPGAAGGPAAAALPAKAAPGVAALGGAGDLIPAARPAGVSSPGLLASAGPGSAKASPAVSAPAV